MGKLAGCKRQLNLAGPISHTERALTASTERRLHNIGLRIKVGAGVEHQFVRVQVTSSLCYFEGYA